jgi:hypothetical protein
LSEVTFRSTSLYSVRMFLLPDFMLRDESDRQFRTTLGRAALLIIALIILTLALQNSGYLSFR